VTQVTDKARIAQLEADLGVLIRATAPHVVGTREIQELVQRYAPDGRETRPAPLGEQRRAVRA
jgi:hypothetical protein